MGITDDLKKRITKVKRIKFADLESLLLMMERIDRAHTSALECAHNAGYEEGYEDHADELRERGCVKLPVDGDRVPWTGNERMFEDMDGHRYTMYGLMYDGERWYVDCGLVGPDKHHHLIEITLVRHAKPEPDTWERIIEDAIRAGFADGDPHDPDQMEASELVARCKALAGEDA